jgi:hypothetical protein
MHLFIDGEWHSVTRHNREENYEGIGKFFVHAVESFD